MNESFLVTPGGLVDIDWYDAKEKRNYLLKDTDWTQMTDAPLTDQQRTAYAEYRQALRDLTQTFANPADIIWPIKPTH
ncbi:tail fiber assembly protein [Veronia pacifica]|uniref:Phage tail assembly chaperone-like domain-containing protein n=1 Tax=Veronia pacifica TaxID=1080227 RepID=A0A1C3E9F5_9GAMM|nr:tail fiber assembly protein [Veronia pacifica]ODA29854.1 hypothetical protein A8L45_21360 [Veronia pacifica]